MPAFEHAVSLGFRYLETDVHRTADGVLVAFHDPDLSRTCGHPGQIASMTWAEISELRVAGREPIPLMRDLLDRFPDARFNIEPKSDDAVEPLASLITATHAIDRVLVGSFSHRRLHRIRRLLGDRLLTATSPPEIASLYLTGWVPGHEPLVTQVPVGAGRKEGLGHVVVVTERFVRWAHRRHIPVHVWTIDDPDEMQRLLDLGVDGIMTDRPEVLRQVLVARGAWYT
jgi:glycerophosphoryl diester phosphodiesterase